MNPKVSVVVIVYNIKKIYLENCLRSLISQKISNYEIIIVDDGSTNGAEKICENFANESTIVNYIRRKNGGPAAARNTGIKNAVGDWIVFVDGDDYISTNMLEEISVRTDSGADLIVFGHYDIHGGKEQERISDSKEVFVELDITRKVEMQRAILHASQALKIFPFFFGAVWNVAYNRMYLVNNNIFFDESLRRGEDSLFNLYAIENANKICYLNKALYYYVIYSNSICHTYKESVISYINCIRLVYQFCKGKDEALINAYYEFSYNYMLEMISLHSCHKNNTMKIDKKISEMREFFSSGYEKEIIQNVTVSSNSKKKKLIVWLLRNHCYHAVYFLMKIHNIMCEKWF